MELTLKDLMEVSGLLTAIALDRNNDLFSVAAGVVECECKDSWSFSIYHLHALLEDAMGTRPWIIISDQQKTRS